MESSAFWGRLLQLVSFFGQTAAISFGILGALSIHRPVWKFTVFLGILGAGFARLFGILGADLRHSGGYIPVCPVPNSCSRRQALWISWKFIRPPARWAGKGI
jgi:hypothetical protein